MEERSGSTFYSPQNYATCQAFLLSVLNEVIRELAAEGVSSSVLESLGGAGWSLKGEYVRLVLLPHLGVRYLKEKMGGTLEFAERLFQTLPHPHRNREKAFNELFKKCS